MDEVDLRIDVPEKSCHSVPFRTDGRSKTVLTIETLLRECREQDAGSHGHIERRHGASGRDATDLVTAFGKGGIQALLIEAAIPELEVEANELLARLSDGRMTLKLETQRQRHSRSTKVDVPPIETLDIIVSDELGARSYELFSGGEAFRINFALRIALSKLLTRRVGAPLPTLFIDEGFGTQDSAGRDHILGVVQAIAEDFQCIIVITHMDEIKDSFPNRIEVHKASQGSSFSVS